jgi:hypothetical protein
MIFSPGGFDMRTAILPLASVGLYLYGETQLTELPYYCRFITELTSFGLMAWFLWYGITKLFPRMIENHKTIEGQNREAFIAQAKEQREHDANLLEKLIERHRLDTERTLEQHRIDNSQVTQTLQDMVRHCSKRGEGE